MAVDLKDLKIEHHEQPSGNPGTNVWKILFILLFICSVVGGYFLYASRPPADNTKQTSTGTDNRPANPKQIDRPEADSFPSTGWVKLPNDYPVYIASLTEGRLEELNVVEGTSVSKGDLIAKLYKKDFENEVASAKAAVDLANAALAKALAGFRTQEIKEAEAELSLKKLERDSLKEIFERTAALPPGTVTKDELTRNESAFKCAEEAIRQIEARLSLLMEGTRKEDIELARKELAKAEADLKIAETRLSYAEILSPIDGKILKRLAVVGQWVKPDAALASIYDPSDIEAQIDVDQANIAKVSIGQKVEITTRAEPDKKHSATVVLMEPLADESKNIVRVKVKFDNPAGAILYPNMIVQARFILKKNAVQGN
jgi:HlyD family secretion protein